MVSLWSVYKNLNDLLTLVCALCGGLTTGTPQPGSNSSPIDSHDRIETSCGYDVPEVSFVRWFDPVVCVHQGHNCNYCIFSHSNVYLYTVPLSSHWVIESRLGSCHWFVVFRPYLFFYLSSFVCSFCIIFLLLLYFSMASPSWQLYSSLFTDDHVPDGNGQHRSSYCTELNLQPQLSV